MLLSARKSCCRKPWRMAAQLATKDRRTYAQIKRDMRQHLLPLVDEAVSFFTREQIWMKATRRSPFYCCPA